MGRNTARNKCERCGTCCTRGGPALHSIDQILFSEKRLNPAQLITVRNGEPAFYPGSAKPVAAQGEIVKIKGKPGEWTCIFFEENSAKCAIYKYRPIECSLLKCWDPEELENIAGRDLLSRFDIIAPDDAMLPIITKHEEQCTLKKIVPLIFKLRKKELQQQTLQQLQDLVNIDLGIRSQAGKTFQLSLDLELFYLGRPLFKILEEFGITTHCRNGVYHLVYS